MKLVTLEDKGQDFLYFEFDENKLLPKIVGAGPFQASIWNDKYILNAHSLEVGVKPIISKSPDDDVLELKYSVVNLQQVVNMVRTKCNGRKTIAVPIEMTEGQFRHILKKADPHYTIDSIDRVAISFEMYEELRIDKLLIHETSK